MSAVPVKTVYAVERQVSEALALGGAVEFHGSTLDLDRCRVQTFAPFQLPLMQGIAAGLYNSHRRPGTRQQAPTVRLSDRAYRRAWYDPWKHEIVLPSMRWSMDTMTLCHEVAHACANVGHDQRSAHGPQWRNTYAAMVAEVVGPEAGLLLQQAMDL